MKYKEMTSMGAQEIQKKRKELQKELMKFRTQAATGASPESAGMMKRIKRDIARINTIQRLPSVSSGKSGQQKNKSDAALENKHKKNE